jgi:hypothetical protein
MSNMLCLLLLLCTAFSAQAKPVKTPEHFQLTAEQIIDLDLAAIPAYALLLKQQKNFAATWQELLRQQLIIGNHQDPHAVSQAIALALAMNISNQFITRADNKSVDKYFQQQRILLQQSQQDPRLCRILLNTATQRADQNGATPWLLEKPYRHIKPELQQAITQLILSAENQWPRILPDEQAQQFMQRIVAQMAHQYGSDSLNRYTLMHNENASPEIRCIGLYQLYETINTQPLELRAQLLRSFFGGT